MIQIRRETKADAGTIAAVTAAAFDGMAFAGGYEHMIPGRLRENGALFVSLVAADGDDIVGHVAFSPVALSDGRENWFGLGPVSVLPKHQNRGIGRWLIEAGLDLLKDAKAAGCVVLGEPDYYTRFGFRQNSGLTYAEAPAEYFMALSFTGAYPAAAVTYDRAFDP